MFVLRFAVILAYVSISVGISSSDPVVKTTTGDVRGATVAAYDDKEADAFLGIPYAVPPVGDLRFRRPLRIPPWDNVLNATEMPPPCYQNITQKFYWTPNTENMTEDCLYINLWTPRSRKNDTQLKAMLVWIYGGAFNLGANNMDVYDGAALAAYGDVIVASMNYRVGFLGFFTAFVDGASGNMGLYDQILALKWLNENAEAFGADKNLITLVGQSAGAISIAGHLISPVTQNLFRRAILESGSAVLSMSLNANEIQAKVSNTLARLTGCSTKTVNLTTNPDAVVECLRSLPAVELSKVEGVLKNSNPITTFPIYGDELLPFQSTKLARARKYKGKEILTGINEIEGSFFLTTAIPEYFGKYGHNGTDNIRKSLALSLMTAMFKLLEQNNTKEIADYYFKMVKQVNTQTLRQAIVDALGDFLITCSSVFFADFYSLAKDSTYYYKFTHRPSKSPNAEWVGSTHFDEVQYVFGRPLIDKVNYTTEENLLSKRIMDRWVAFAKTGNPSIPGTLKWPTYSHRYPVYLEIGGEETIRLRPNKGRCEFWRDRFEAHLDLPNFTESLRTEYLRSSSLCPYPARTLTLILLWVLPRLRYL